MYSVQMDILRKNIRKENRVDNNYCILTYCVQFVENNIKSRVSEERWMPYLFSTKNAP